MIAELIEVARPKQWYKNLIVFAAIFFSQNIFNLDMLTTTILAFVSLCLLSSGSYVLNDILDADADKHHDNKKKRPIAAGKLSSKIALVWVILLLLIGFLVSSYVNKSFFIISAILVLLMQAYNLIFKNIPFADVAILSTNFMLRAFSGAIAIDVPSSPWLILGAYLLALFLSIAKRISDMRALGKKASLYKKVFLTYTPELLDKFLIMAGTLLFITYCLYLFLRVHLNLLLIMATIPITFFLIFRYYYISISNGSIVRDPERVFSDIQMVIGMLLWIAILFIGFYV